MCDDSCWVFFEPVGWECHEVELCEGKRRRFEEKFTGMGKLSEVFDYGHRGVKGVPLWSFYLTMEKRYWYHLTGCSFKSGSYKRRDIIVFLI